MCALRTDGFPARFRVLLRAGVLVGRKEQNEEEKLKKRNGGGCRVGDEESEERNERDAPSP